MTKTRFLLENCSLECDVVGHCDVRVDVGAPPLCGQLTARSSGMIRFVTFDALHTLITPRKPIHVQYSEVFRPYLGTLPPDAISRSFKLGVLFYPVRVVSANPK